MSGIYEHIHFKRETVIRERRRNPFPPPKFEGNKSEHAQTLTEQLHRAKQLAATKETPGYDNRILLKLNIREGFEPASFESIAGIQIVSQENKEIVLLFTTELALTEFEKRLATYGSTGDVTRKELIEATRAFDLWTEEDRLGKVLEREGLPSAETFILDVELWPLENRQERDSMLSAFREWATDTDFIILDTISNNYLTIARLKCAKVNYKNLFHYRDVRTIDLPPRYTLEYSLLNTDITDIPEPETPPLDAPRVAILDSGLNSGHPLVQAAVGDRRSYINGLGPEDKTGHGTAVAGIALYGDIQEALANKTFTPHFWILSGRILDDQNEYSEKFIENQVEQAVREFHSDYDCKIFNLSIGDALRPYSGGKAGTFPMTLDNLSHELGVLFIVSAGNILKSEIIENLKANIDYPDYLFNNSSILEPANAMNALTVGSIARYDKSRTSARYINDPAYQPLAQINSVSPFSRLGHGISGCIKPEIVAYGGNLSHDARTNSLSEHGLGELTLNHSYTDGKLFSEKLGTSFSAPHLTHLAGRLLANIGHDSVLLLRSLIVGHAKNEMLNFPKEIKDDDKLRMAGYGKIDEEHLYRSGEEVVVLYAVDKIEDDKNHFYEIPLPSEFFNGRRKREVTITLSYFAPARNTRVNYRGMRMFYKFIKGTTLEQAVRMFDKETPKDQYKNIPEFGTLNRNINAESRSNGTVQSSTWTIKQPDKKSKYFIVITRNDHPWGKRFSRDKEEYVLTIILRDREQTEANLYSKIAEMIKQRVRGRSTVK
ncbi:MAG: S8 family peptidase [Leptospirales bacterium]